MNRGSEAEALAARFLQERGLTIIARNYRCRGGEIDLIARDGASLVFVEVRLRRGNAFGGAAASITASKRRRLGFARSIISVGSAASPRAASMQFCSMPSHRNASNGSRTS